ncbi:MAG: hypothetical protein K9G58_14750 [Bacteroidales bacterium]|nr:hypothetical protein [Bacteroidales bacterium]MCF8387766.1 hypothetical protein [Bacteroidales bacterium]MCF8399430.1 hypothetical protein [Bacteroidales bacterium]
MLNENNDILKKLIAETDLEKAPGGFTAKVMKKVRAEEKSQSLFDPGGFLSPQYWLLIGSALGIALIFIFSFDIPLLSWLIENADLRNITKILGQFLLNIQAYITQIDISTTSIAIFAGIGMLILIDRLLRKRFAFGIFSL